MKKTVFKLITCLSLTGFVVKAQHRMPCATDEIQQHWIKTIPGYKEKIEAVKIEREQQLQNYLANQQLSRSTSSAQVTYTIPIVFHILHTGGPENISDASVRAAVDQLNKHYARKNADTIQLDPLYDPLFVNSGVHFALAKKDPNGNCTTGIIHHYDTNTDWPYGDYTNCVYTGNQPGRWSTSKYLNIYVVRAIVGGGEGIGGVGGYAQFPGAAPNSAADIIVISLGNFGNGTQTEAHEIGHWLALPHTFNGNNGFNQTTKVGNICGDDGIADTPKTPGFLGICPNYSTVLDSCEPGKRPNLQNIMDYADCPIMFTQGQTDVVRFSLQSSLGGRNNLSSTQNLIDVGLINPSTTPCGPIADFASNKQVVCNGQSATFVNTSYNSTPTSYAWTFEGGTPATSSLTSQSVTYNTPGPHSVTLTVSNANGTSTKVSTNYIYSEWNSSSFSYPYSEGFESGVLPNGWYVDNQDLYTVKWESVNYGSQNSQKSLFLNNSIGFVNTNGIYALDGNVDVLLTPQFNFKNTSNISISFDYSTARPPGIAGTTSSLKFQYSLDCGGTWVNVPGTLPKDSAMAAKTGGVLSAPYAPTSNKWFTQSYSAAMLGSIFNNKSDVKFRFIFTNDFEKGLKNIYIDNFNISGTVGLNELENTIGLSLYPNPTNSSSTIEFTTPVNTNAEVTVYDVTGRVVETKHLKTNANEATKYDINQSDNLNSGIYFITLSINNQKVTKKLIVE